jgi:mannosyltransferase OCH1-like enzyme
MLWHDATIARRRCDYPGPVIPRILHQIWVGPDPLPEEFAAYRETWRAHHGAWEMRLWEEGTLPSDLRWPEAYERARTPAERADLIRLELLWRFGGVYLDVDFECCRPIDDLLEGVELFAASLKPGGRTNNAMIGAIPAHPLLGRALDRARIQEPGEPFDKTASGSLFFDSIISGQPGVTVMPAELFYPATPEQRRGAYAIHHAARSWKDSDGWQKAALRAEQRLDKTTRTLEKEVASHAKAREKLEQLQAELTTLRTESAALRAENKRLVDEAPAKPERSGERGKFSFLRSD